MCYYCKYLNVNLFIIAILKCTRHIFLSYYKLPKYLPKFNYILTLHQCANLKKKAHTCNKIKKNQRIKKTTKERVVNVSKSES